MLNSLNHDFARIKSNSVNYFSVKVEKNALLSQMHVLLKTDIKLLCQWQFWYWSIHTEFWFLKKSTFSLLSVIWCYTNHSEININSCLTLFRWSPVCRLVTLNALVTDRLMKIRCLYWSAINFGAALEQCPVSSNKTFSNL